MSPKKKTAAVPSERRESDSLKVVREYRLPPDTDVCFDVEKHVPKPLPSEPPKPFDKKTCIEKLKKIAKTEYTHAWDWSAIPFDEVLSPEEATYWLELAFLRKQNFKKQYILNLAEKIEVKTIPSLEEIKEKIAEVVGFTPLRIPFLLRSLFKTEEILQILCEWTDGLDRWGLHNAVCTILPGLVYDVFPYADRQSLKRVHAFLKKELKKPLVTTDPYEPFPLAVYLAAGFDFPAEMERIVAGFPDDLFAGTDWDHSHYRMPQCLVTALDSTDKIVREMKRLRLPLLAPGYLDFWILRTGCDELDWVFDSLTRKYVNKDQCVALVEHLAKIVDHPDLAPLMLRLKWESKANTVAAKWFETHPGNAICGLLPLVAQKGKLAEQAVDFLRIKKRRGCGPFIEQCLAGMPPEVVEAVRREILDHEEIVYPPLKLAAAPEPLRNAFSDEKSLSKTKLPGWIAAEMLPPLTVGKSALTGGQVTFLLRALKSSDFGTEKIHPAVAAVKECVSENSRSAFVWKLFEIWLGEGAPSKENWAMKALGLLGGDDAALKLTPLVRVWPGESQHKRAVLGLECLRAVGTDTALMQLNGISQKLKFQGLKKQAALFMEEIAKARGMTRPELEDRVVPDCELDENGKRIFDFGPRQFEFGLGPDLKPMVRGEDGKYKSDLPKPNSKDDPEKSAEAVADWKRMKKQIREVVKLQSVRLEEAMIAGRSWTSREFEQLLVRHPLMSHLVRLILWGIFDEQGKFLSAFRVTDESDFADENDEPVELPKGEALRIRVVHPLNFTDEQKRRWGEILSDYELIPPFRQLGRETYVLDPARSDETDLNPGPIGKLPGVSLAGMLDKSGWQRALPADAGGFYEHTKPFYGANVTAVCQYDPGLFAGGVEYWDDQTVTHYFFIPGIYTPNDWYPGHEKRVPLKDVDPIVLSESLAVLKSIESKIK